MESESQSATTTTDEVNSADEYKPSDREMLCPVCGSPMPDLKGGKDSICPICGFKDSCCY